MNTHATIYGPRQPLPDNPWHGNPYWRMYGNKDDVFTSSAHLFYEMYKKLLLSNLSRREKKVIGIFIPIAPSHMRVCDEQYRDGQL